jgi:NADP-dependent 3-hydroxy acid dehydrogenase YdfG
MSQRTWFITGVSSGFGRQLTHQLLARGDRVVGTVRDTGKVADLRERYPKTFHVEVLDVTCSFSVSIFSFRRFVLVVSASDGSCRSAVSSCSR